MGKTYGTAGRKDTDCRKQDLPRRYKESGTGIRTGAANAVISGPGSRELLQGVRSAETAREAGYSVIAGHNCGETADTAAADLAVAFGAAQIRFGAPLCMENAEKI